jgi:PEP-CTERM motif
LLGTVNLVAGNTYTVTQEATANTFVSQRAHAVMWEPVSNVPEPSTVALLGLACFGLLIRRHSA